MVRSHSLSVCTEESCDRHAYLTRHTSTTGLAIEAGDNALRKSDRANG